MASPASSSALPAGRPFPPSPSASPPLAGGPTRRPSLPLYPQPQRALPSGPRERKEERELREQKDEMDQKQSMERFYIFAKTIKRSCIKKRRTKKPRDATEWSYVDKEYQGFNIFPSVLDQGEAGICQFCAVHAAAQMEINGSYAREGANSKIQFVWNDDRNVLKRYLELHGFRPGIDTEDTATLLQMELIDRENAVFDFEDGSCWCFKHMGVTAKIDNGCNDKMLGQPHETMFDNNRYLRYWENGDKKLDMYLAGSALAKPMVNICIDNYKRVDDLLAGEVRDLMRNGRALIANLQIGKQFKDLKEDEIYCWIPIWDDKHNKWFDEPDSHAVVLIGNGDAGPTLEHEQYHPFLNSHGDSFAKSGVGCVFFKGLFPEYQLVEIEVEPTHGYPEWYPVAGRPKIMPPKRPPSVEAIAPPSQDHRPSPQRPPRYVPPHQLPGRYVPPHLRGTRP